MHSIFHLDPTRKSMPSVIQGFNEIPIGNFQAYALDRLLGNFPDRWLKNYEGASCLTGPPIAAKPSNMI